MQELTKSKVRAFVTPFAAGFLVKEVVLFIREGGMSDEHPLARSLFTIMICSVLLFWLWGNDQVETVNEKLWDLREDINRNHHAG